MAASSASRRDCKLGPNDSKYVFYKVNKQSSKSINKDTLSSFLSLFLFFTFHSHFLVVYFLENLPERCILFGEDIEYIFHVVSKSD